jgi:hypothetical protein
MLLEDYACFRVPSFSFDMTVKQIVNLSCARGLPVMALVEDHGEQCLILVACQQPWADWFSAIFIEGNEQLFEPLSPIITKLLVEYTIQAQKASSDGKQPTEEENKRFASLSSENGWIDRFLPCWQMRNETGAPLKD